MNFPAIGINSNDGRKLPADMARAALSGAYGPTVSRFRFYLVPINDEEYPRIYDFTEAVTTFSCDFDADTCRRSGSITFDTNMWGVTGRVQNVQNMNLHFILNRYAFFVAHEILIHEQWFRWPVGYFTGHNLNLEQIGQRPAGITTGVFDTQGPRMLYTYQLKDITTYFDSHVTSTTYTVAAGTEYIDAVKAAVIASGFYQATTYPLDPAFKVKKFAIGSSGKVVPNALVFEPNTPWSRIFTTLLDGCNYFPMWSSNEGYLTSGPRISPSKLVVNDWWGPGITPWQYQPLVNPDYDTLAVWGLRYPNVTGSIKYQMQQESLWNQVIISAQNISGLPTTLIAQIANVANNSWLALNKLYNWVTKMVTVEAPADVTTLREIADWHCYYADFHSTISNAEQPTEFFNDRIISPYINSVFIPGRNQLGLYPGLTADLGYQATMGRPTMTKKYGHALDPYYLNIAHPAAPSS